MQILNIMEIDAVSGANSLVVQPTPNYTETSINNVINTINQSNSIGGINLNQDWVHPELM